MLTGRTRRALDSAVLLDAVATQDTITQLIAAIRRVARQVPGASALVAVVSGLVKGRVARRGLTPRPPDVSRASRAGRRGPLLGSGSRPQASW